MNVLREFVFLLALLFQFRGAASAASLFDLTPTRFTGAITLQQRESGAPAAASLTPGEPVAWFQKSEDAIPGTATRWDGHWIQRRTSLRASQHRKLAEEFPITAPPVNDHQMRVDNEQASASRQQKLPAAPTATAARDNSLALRKGTRMLGASSSNGGVTLQWWAILLIVVGSVAGAAVVLTAVAGCCEDSTFDCVESCYTGCLGCCVVLSCFLCPCFWERFTRDCCETLPFLGPCFRRCEYCNLWYVFFPCCKECGSCRVEQGVHGHGTTTCKCCKCCDEEWCCECICCCDTEHGQLRCCAGDGPGCRCCEENCCRNSEENCCRLPAGGESNASGSRMPDNLQRGRRLPGIGPLTETSSGSGSAPVSAKMDRSHEDYTEEDDLRLFWRMGAERPRTREEGARETPVPPAPAEMDLGAMARGMWNAVSGAYSRYRDTVTTAALDRIGSVAVAAAAAGAARGAAEPATSGNARASDLENDEMVAAAPSESTGPLGLAPGTQVKLEGLEASGWENWNRRHLNGRTGVVEGWIPDDSIAGGRYTVRLFDGPTPSSTPIPSESGAENTPSGGSALGEGRVQGFKPGNVVLFDDAGEWDPNLMSADSATEAEITHSPTSHHATTRDAEARQAGCPLPPRGGGGQALVARIVGDGFDTDEITRAIRASMAESAAMAESVVATRPLPVASAPPASGGDGVAVVCHETDEEGVTAAAETTAEEEVYHDCCGNGVAAVTAAEEAESTSVEAQGTGAASAPTGAARGGASATAPPRRPSSASADSGVQLSAAAVVAVGRVSSMFRAGRERIRGATERGTVPGPVPRQVPRQVQREVQRVRGGIRAAGEQQADGEKSVGERIVERPTASESSSGDSAGVSFSV